MAVNADKGTDIIDASFLRRLYEAKLAEADPKLDEEGRRREADTKMDKLFADLWREVIEPSGVEAGDDARGCDPETRKPFMLMVELLADREKLGDR